MKKLLAIAFLSALRAYACEEGCNQKPSPINCEEAMHSYSETIESYASAVERINLPELVKFRVWLIENGTIHITCSAYNQSEIYEKHYENIFLANIRMTGSIRGLVLASEVIGKSDEGIERQLKASFTIMRNSTKFFNKSLQHAPSALDSL